MVTRLKLKPGQKGTKALVEKYGDALVCVRYRYDEMSRTRIKTVDLIVEKKELSAPQQVSVDDALVPVRISYGERELGEMAKTMGGKWDPDVKLWYIKHGKIKGTELEKHIYIGCRNEKQRRAKSIYIPASNIRYLAAQRKHLILYAIWHLKLDAGIQ